MADVNLAASGKIGVEPPPDAPREVSHALDPMTVANQVALARAHERELAPLVYEKPPALESAIAGKQIAGLDPFYEKLNARIAAGQANPMPAMSNTDSPSRGMPGTAPIPAARSKAPIQVIGGFGDGGEAQYFPLTGVELKILIEELMDDVHQRIQNDLRFSIAQCYPRVTAKVQIVVEGETTDGGFVIQKTVQKHETPLEVAQRYGDSVVFVVTADRREFTEAGEVSSPPDALRDELGLPKPRKQQVSMAGGQSFADVPLEKVGF